MQLSDHLVSANIVLDLEAASKRELILKLSEMASKKTGTEAAHISSALTNREGLGSTGIGQGIAVPHAIIDGLQTGLCMFARLAKPIEFDAVDEVPVDLVVLLLSSPEEQRQNLNLLSSIARLLRDEEKADMLRSANTVEEAHDLLTGAKS